MDKEIRETERLMYAGRDHGRYGGFIWYRTTPNTPGILTKKDPGLHQGTIVEAVVKLGREIDRNRQWGEVFPVLIKN